jgi:hypothetical protein
VGRIYDRRKNSLGRESAFIDVDKIPAGRDFVEVSAFAAAMRCSRLAARIGSRARTRTIADAVARDTPTEWTNREDFSRECGRHQD